MLPNVSAIEYNEVNESIKKSITLDFKDLNNQIKYLINTLTNGIVISILLVILFAYEIYFLIFIIPLVVISGYSLSFIEKLLSIFLFFIWINLDTLGFFMVEIMETFNLDWFPFFNIILSLYRIVESILESIWEDVDNPYSTMVNFPQAANHFHQYLF